MQMTTWMTYWRMALLSGVAGAIVAGAIAFAIHDQYVCTAALEVDNHGDQHQAQLALGQALPHVVGHDSLLALVQDPQLALYREERRHMPLDRVVEDTFRKHVHVIPYADHGSAVAFRVVFSYPDKYQAKAVVERLTTVFQHEMAQNSSGATLAVLENPVLPQVPAYPQRLSIVILGLVAGMLTGLVALACWRRTRAYAVVTMSLPRETKSFIDRQVAAGQYRSAADYLSDLIRADEQRHK